MKKTAQTAQSCVVIPFPARRIKRRHHPIHASPGFDDGLLAGLQMAADLARRGLLRTAR